MLDTNKEFEMKKFILSVVLGCMSLNASAVVKNNKAATEFCSNQAIALINSDPNFGTPIDSQKNITFWLEKVGKGQPMFKGKIYKIVGEVASGGHIDCGYGIKVQRGKRKTTGYMNVDFWKEGGKIKFEIYDSTDDVTRGNG